MMSTLKQLRDEALTYLVLWAASKEYSPDIEAALKHWAATFEISETELMDRIMAASTGKLTKPDPNVSEAPAAEEDTQPTAGQEPAADTAADPASAAGSEPAAAEEQQQQQQQQEQQAEPMQEDQ